MTAGARVARQGGRAAAGTGHAPSAPYSVQDPSYTATSSIPHRCNARAKIAAVTPVPHDATMGRASALKSKPLSNASNILRRLERLILVEQFTEKHILTSRDVSRTHALARFFRLASETRRAPRVDDLVRRVGDVSHHLRLCLHQRLAGALEIFRPSFRARHRLRARARRRARTLASSLALSSVPSPVAVHAGNRRPTRARRPIRSLETSTTRAPPKTSRSYRTQRSVDRASIPTSRTPRRTRPRSTAVTSWAPKHSTRPTPRPRRNTSSSRSIVARSAPRRRLVSGSACANSRRESERRRRARATTRPTPMGHLAPTRPSPPTRLERARARDDPRNGCDKNRSRVSIESSADRGRVER